jgi:predicted short-subunit dehydrogenase-like oxidoreductase (DUF2520 family)
MDMPTISIIGIGRVGGSLAIALSRTGFGVDLLVHRDGTTANAIAPYLPPGTRFVKWSDDLEPFTSDIVLITTADPDISPVASELPNRLKKGSTVMHTSGSLSSDSLAVLADAGHPTAALHPLVSVSDAVSGADKFSGAFFCIEGSEKALNEARTMVEALGGRAFSIDTSKKSLYHAAAVTACGHLIALIDTAIEMLSKCGIKSSNAQEILLPLISSTIANLQTRSPADALTGSFARFDVDAIERHLAAIRRYTSDEVKDIYLLLGERSLELAATSKENTAGVEKVRKLISIAKRKTG